MAKRTKMRWSVDGTELTVGGVWVAVRLGGGNVGGWTINIDGLPRLSGDATIRSTNHYRHHSKEAAQRIAESMLRKWLEATGLKQHVQFLPPEDYPTGTIPAQSKPRKLDLALPEETKYGED